MPKKQEPIKACFYIYGRLENCHVLKVYPHGTVDVERLSDGRCFRISGLKEEQTS